MKAHLSEQEERRVAGILAPYLENKRIQQLKKYPHHGKVTTYEHCNHVAKACYWANRHWHLRADERMLVTTGFLHDFYLYDWHKKDAAHRWHMFRHPAVAAKNATEDFRISAKEQRIIKTHMWPVTPLKLPTSREAWIVSLADKYCTVVELMHNRRRK